MEKIFREETKEEVLEEFRARITSEDNYIPTYFDYSIIEAQHKDLIRLTKKLGYNVECIFTKDFKNNKNELKEQIKSWFKRNKIKLYETNESSEEQKLDEEVKYILKIFKQNSGSGLNIMREDVDGNLVELILYGFANTKFNTYVTIFHELGHTLEAKYLKPGGKLNEDVSPIKEFLYRYQEETTANLFAYSILYLMFLQKTTDKNVLESAKNCIIKSAVLGGACSEGYFSVPVVIENIDRIKIERYINKENKIDFEKLYDFCFKTVQIKAEQYEKILIGINADKEYINSHFSYKILEELEIKKDKNELEEDLYIQYSVYKKMVDEKSPLILKDALKFVLDYCIKVDELKDLEKIMKYLRSDQFNYARIERGLMEFNRVVDKYEYYTKRVSQLVQKQGNSKIYFFVKTDYLNCDKIDDDKLNQDLNGLEFENLKQNILRHFETSIGQNLSYYGTDDSGKIHFTDFIVFAEYNDLKVIFHELCHSLQHSFNNSRKPINMNKKREFLLCYRIETQADLFSYLLYILDNINDKYDVDFDKILFESAERNGLDGYFSFPILKELIDREIKTDPQKFLDEFKTENEIDIEKLFNFVVKKVRVKEQIYTEFVLDEGVNFDTLISYFCAKKNEKTEFPDVYKHSQLEEDLRNNEIYRREYKNRLLQKCVNDLHINELNKQVK